MSCFIGDFLRRVPLISSLNFIRSLLINRINAGFRHRFSENTY